MEKKNIRLNLVLLFAFILGVLVDYLFYGKPLGISFFVFISLLLIFSLTLAKKFGQKLPKIRYCLLLPIILFSAMLFCRSSSFLTFFNVWGSLFLIILFLALFLEKSLLDFNLLEYFIVPLGFVFSSFRKAGKFIEVNKERFQKDKKFGSPEFWSIAKGIVLTIPIIAILIWLLSSADIVFQKYLESLIDININIDAAELILRILIVLLASYLFIGFFAKAFTGKKADKGREHSYAPLRRSETGNGARSLGPIESSIILGAVELLFLVFIAIQFFYLFGGKTYVWGIEEYITYSEYAKKGFTELIAVSIISFLLIYGIDKFGKREGRRQKQLFKILSAILTLEIFVIIASAFKRLSLYVDGYGYTFSRLLTFVFLFWFFSAFLLFLYKIISEQKATHFIFSLFWLTVLFWLGLNVLNPDAFIAKKNIERYIQGKEFDICYLGRLSDDAIPEIIKIFEMEIDKKIKIDLANNLYYMCQKEDQKWQSFNLSQHRASTVLQERQCKWIREYCEKCDEKFKKCLD